MNEPAEQRLAQVFESHDPEAFGTSATPHHGSRLVVRSKGRFRGWRVQLNAGNALLNRGRTSQAVTFHVGTGARTIFSLPASPHGAARITQGALIGAEILAWWRTDAEIHSQWPADLQWWNLVFPADLVSRAADIVYGGRLLTPQESVRFVTLHPQERRRLYSALEGALSAPATVNRARLSDGLLTLVLGTLASQAERAAGDVTLEHRLGHKRHLAIADGLVALADRVDEPVSLLSVCQELEVSLRTLNACSNAILGLGAAGYLRQRRLNRVFHDLRHGLAGSVTEAAVRHGFWELGRFAGSYRAAFGETPSGTLRSSGGPRGAPGAGGAGEAGGREPRRRGLRPGDAPLAEIAQ